MCFNRLCLILVALALVPAREVVAADKYGVTIENNVTMTTRDGITLRADVYRPDADGKFPVILERTPYDKHNGTAFGLKAAAHGFVYVVQDCRGRLASDGDWYPFKFESMDGYDAVEWAAALPYANGKVGMVGGSYVGATQMLAAVTAPPHLMGILPVVTGSNYHENWTYQGGAFTQSFNEGLIFAKLTPHGVPAGFMGREMLKYYGQVAEGLDYLRATPASFGWNFLLADANGDMAAAEIDSDITERPEGGFYAYSADPDDPENLDAAGRLYGSIGPDDLRIASHYQKDLNEIGYQLVTFNIQPQRYWSSFYFRSLRAFYNAGNALAAEYGQLDRKRVMNILGREALADQRDSMVAAVFEPQTLKMFVAAGEVPATDAGFRAFDLKKRFQGGTAR